MACRAASSVAAGWHSRSLCRRAWGAWHAYVARRRAKRRDLCAAAEMYERAAVQAAVAHCLSVGLQMHQRALDHSIHEHASQLAQQLKLVRPYALLWLERTRARMRRHAPAPASMLEHRAAWAVPRSAYAANIEVVPSDMPASRMAGAKDTLEAIPCHSGAFAHRQYAASKQEESGVQHMQGAAAPCAVQQPCMPWPQQQRLQPFEQPAADAGVPLHIRGLAAPPDAQCETHNVSRAQDVSRGPAWPQQHAPAGWHHTASSCVSPAWCQPAPAQAHSVSHRSMHEPAQQHQHFSGTANDRLRRVTGATDCHQHGYFMHHDDAAGTMRSLHNQLPHAVSAQLHWQHPSVHQQSDSPDHLRCAASHQRAGADHVAGMITVGRPGARSPLQDLNAAPQLPGASAEVPQNTPSSMYNGSASVASHMSGTSSKHRRQVCDPFQSSCK